MKIFFGLVGQLVRHSFTGKWTFADTGVLAALVSILFLPVYIIIR